MTQILRRTHPCAGCSAQVKAQLSLAQSTPELVAAGNMFLRTWIKLADERCTKCRKPEHTDELAQFESFMAMDIRTFSFEATLEGLEKALTWAANNAPRSGLKLIDTGNPIELIKARLTDVENRIKALEKQLWREVHEKRREEEEETNAD